MTRPSSERRAPGAGRRAALLLAATVAACNAGETDGRRVANGGTLSRPTDTVRVTQASAGDAATRAGSPAAPRADSILWARADTARIQGRANAPVWVIEISDFQCPYCKRWHDETYPALKREYIESGKIRFAYFNLPLPSHKNAWPAAEAAMCGGAQRKFWEMHDGIFDTQTRWGAMANPQPLFDSLATHAGLDVAAFRQCMSARSMRALIQADYDRAVGAGVSSTPFFLVDRIGLAGAYPIADFRKVIDSALSLKR